MRLDSSSSVALLAEGILVFLGPPFEQLRDVHWHEAFDQPLDIVSALLALFLLGSAILLFAVLVGLAVLDDMEGQGLAVVAVDRRK